MCSDEAVSERGIQFNWISLRLVQNNSASHKTWDLFSTYYQDTQAWHNYFEDSEAFNDVVFPGVFDAC